MRCEHHQSANRHWWDGQEVHRRNNRCCNHQYILDVCTRHKTKLSPSVILTSIGLSSFGSASSAPVYRHCMGFSEMCFQRVESWLRSPPPLQQRQRWTYESRTMCVANIIFPRVLLNQHTTLGKRRMLVRVQYLSHQSPPREQIQDERLNYCVIGSGDKNTGVGKGRQVYG